MWESSERVYSMHKNLRFGVCTCILVWICACVHASLADSGGRLEIKTLCGTRLMIALELKQKARRRRAPWKKMERGEEKERMARAGGGGEVLLSERGRSERLPLLQSYSLCLGCFLSECEADLSHWLPSVSSLLKCESNWGNWWSQRNISETRKRIAVERVDVHEGRMCAHSHTHKYMHVSAHSLTLTHTHTPK